MVEPVCEVLQFVGLLPQGVVPEVTWETSDHSVLGLDVNNLSVRGLARVVGASVKGAKEEPVNTGFIALQLVGHKKVRKLFVAEALYAPDKSLKFVVLNALYAPLRVNVVPGLLGLGKTV